MPRNVYNYKSQTEVMKNNSERYLSDSNQEQFKIQKIIRQVKLQKHLSFEDIMEKCNHCWKIRQEQQFLNYMFAEHVDIIKTMIDWVLRPYKFVSINKLRNRQALYKKKRYVEPFVCKHFFQNNETFFTIMIKATIQNIFPIEYWFNFLFEQIKDNFIFDTSLGYFKDIMVKYFEDFDLPNETNQQAYSSQNLDQSDSGSNNQLELPVQLAPLRRGLKACSLVVEQCQIYHFVSPKALRIFSNELISKLLEVSYHQTVFIFIYNIIFRCLEESDQKENEKGNEILKLLLKQSKTRNDIYINLVELLSQLSQNFAKDTSKIIQKCILQIIESSIIEQTIKKIKQSSFCNYTDSNSELPKITQKQIDEDQQEHVEKFLQILRLMLKIYNQIWNSHSESVILNIFEKKIQTLMMQMNKMINIVKAPQNKSFAFSTGNNIKPITMVRYKYFQLLLQCLLIEKKKAVNNRSWLISIPKTQIFLLVERYLEQNNWNNNVQHVLTKIIDCLASQYHTIFLSQQFDKNILCDSFLGFLIKTFRNKNYVYLETLRHTERGNTNTVFEISKAIITELNEHNMLIPTLKLFQEWKKFVFVDLRCYQEKMKQSITNLSQQTLIRYANKCKKNTIKIDEVQPIRKLIEQVNTVADWSIRQAKRRQKISRSAVYHRSKPNFKRSEFQSGIATSTGVTTNNSIFGLSINSYNSIKNNKISSPPILAEDLEQSLKLSSNQQEEIKIQLAELQQSQPKLKSKASVENNHTEVVKRPLRKAFSIKQRLQQIDEELKKSQHQLQNISNYESIAKKMQKKLDNTCQMSY